MSNNKQTAVEWLIDESSKFEKGESEYFSTTIIKNKAIRMEKQQIVEAYRLGHIFHDSNDSDSPEEYYNTEYGTK